MELGLPHERRTQTVGMICYIFWNVTWYNLVEVYRLSGGFC